MFPTYCGEVSGVSAGFTSPVTVGHGLPLSLASLVVAGRALFSQHSDSQGPLSGHNVATTARVESSSLGFKIAPFATSETNIIGQLAPCASYGTPPNRLLTLMISFQWGLNRHRGSASVVFPVEIWLLILENLELRDLYSLTVASKYFYNNFISIYLKWHPGKC